METSVVNLQTLIGGLQQYIVPLFQRPYSWEIRDWDTLWKDLLEIATREDYPTYFIGSIVTLQNPTTPGTPAIRDDFNVSSIGDNGTGDYTVNLS